MSDSTIYVIVLFTSGLMILRAIAQIIASHRHVLNILNFLSLICLSIIPVQMMFVYIGPQGIPPVFYYLQLTSLFVPGPASYCYLSISTKKWIGWSAMSTAHFLPAILVCTLETTIQILPGYIGLPIIRTLRTAVFSQSINPFIIIRFAGLAHLAVYMAMYLHRFFRIYSHHKIPRVRRISLYSAIYVIPVLAILMASHVVALRPLAAAGIVMSSALIFFWFLVSYKFPEFLTMSREAVHRGRYERSRIESIDADEIQKRLKVIMETDKAFCDEDITLRSVAEELSITIHQLSEFLNTRLGMSFKSFINTHRIDEARKLLAEEPSRSILSTAYAVGFNSRSNFNRVFFEITGVTPTDYRERLGKRRPSD